MSSDEKSLVVRFQGSDLKFITPVVSNNAKKNTITQISNAWKDCTKIDEKGWLWVSEEKLHSILRTSKSNIPHIVMGIEERYKITINNKTHIRGFVVISLIEKSIEESIGTKETYLEVSKQYHDAINKCESVRLLRLEYSTALSEERKNLKKKRKNKYKIKYDELTGEKLKWGAEFSHIRSFALYKEYGDSIENGLIVNKETHKIITGRGINHEDDLLELCEELEWNTKWYENFKEWVI